MGLIAKVSEGGSFVSVAPGMHLARCYRVIDLGKQKSEWQGKINILPKVMIQFEVHSEDDDGKPLVTPKGEPMSISKNFTVSLQEKATLRKDLVSWRGREFTKEEADGFHLKNVLGAWAMLTIAKSVGNNGKEYTNIMSINPVPPAIKKAGMPESHNQAMYFEIESPNMEMFKTFSDNLRAKIESSPEWQARKGDQYAKEQNASANSKGSGFDDMDDDIPF